MKVWYALAAVLVLDPLAVFLITQSSFTETVKSFLVGFAVMFPVPGLVFALVMLYRGRNG